MNPEREASGYAFMQAAGLVNDHLGHCPAQFGIPRHGR